MATRIRKTAQVYACNSREEAQIAIKQLGDLQREHARITTELNDAIARITEAEAPRLDALRQRMETLQAGVQTWCEANREQLCGKSRNVPKGRQKQQRKKRQKQRQHEGRIQHGFFRAHGLMPQYSMQLLYHDSSTLRLWRRRTPFTTADRLPSARRTSILVPEGT